MSVPFNSMSKEKKEYHEVKLFECAARVVKKFELADFLSFLSCVSFYEKPRENNEGVVDHYYFLEGKKFVSRKRLILHSKAMICK
jgi:hypothetical protein